MKILQNMIRGNKKSMEMIKMTEKRFERIYADVDVFCRDHNAKGVSQLIEREDYDRIVDLLNEQHEQIENLKDANVRCCNEYSYFHKRMMQVEKENEKLKQQNEFLKKRCDEYWEEAGLNNDYFE